MSEPVAMAKGKEAFAYQAAKIGIWAPVICLGLGCFTQTQRDKPPMVSVSMMLGFVSLAFLVIGFAMSVVALASVAKHGRKGLLVRGLVGFCLNGLFLAATAYMFLYAPWSSAVPKYVGVWELQGSGSGVTRRLELGADKRFHFTATGTSTADFSGDWRLQWDRGTSHLFVVLKVTRFVSGAEGIEGKTLPLEVERIDPDRLVIVTSKGQDIYRRVGGGPRGMWLGERAGA